MQEGNPSNDGNQPWEVMKEAVADPGVKRVASDMGISESLLYKWCQDPTGEDASGITSPLARLARLVSVCPDHDMLNWLCRHADGFFVPNPDPEKLTAPLVQNVRTTVRRFSDLLDTVSESIDDGKVDADESRKIRKEWEELKRHVEQFTTACECGRYDKGRRK